MEYFCRHVLKLCVHDYRANDRWPISPYYLDRKRRHGGSSRWTLR
jgi:hypothetical protein